MLFISSIEDIIIETIIIIFSPRQPLIFVSITVRENVPELVHIISIEFVPNPDCIVPPITVQSYVDPKLDKTE